MSSSLKLNEESIMNTQLEMITFIIIFILVAAFILSMGFISENASAKTYKSCVLALVAAMAAVLITMITVSVKYVSVAGLVHRIKHGPVVVVWRESKDKKDIDAALAAVSDAQLKRAYYYYNGKCKRCGKCLVHAVVPAMTEKQKILDRYDELTKVYAQ